MPKYEFTQTTTDSLQFFDFDAGVLGYVTVDRHGPSYTIERFVGENDETIDYMFDTRDLILFERELDEYLESSRDAFEEWDMVSGI
jgi:hypothetical protein